MGGGGVREIESVAAHSDADTVYFGLGGSNGTGPHNVDAVTSVVVRGGSEIPTIDTVGGPGAAVFGCFVDNNAGSGG